MAATTFGWQCPVEQTAIPAAKSRKVFPSGSSTMAPEARSATSGESRVSEGDIYFASYAITSFALGPGNAVLILGSLVSVAVIMISPECVSPGIRRKSVVAEGRETAGLWTGADLPNLREKLLNRRYKARDEDSPGETCEAHEDQRLRDRV